MSYEKDYQNTFTKNQNASYGILERTYSPNLSATICIFQSRGFFSRISIDKFVAHSNEVGHLFQFIGRSRKWSGLFLKGDHLETTYQFGESGNDLQQP